MNKQSIIETIEKRWYGHGIGFLWPLFPLTLMHRLIARRRFLKRRHVALSPPVIVIGNINIGGTGKTPLIGAMTRYYQAQGLRVGIIARGYGANITAPLVVTAQHTAQAIGDEALIHRDTGATVCLCPDRDAAYQKIKSLVDIVLSDDGLQHYALARSFEIAVVDARRQLGNRQLLPCGPLREPAHRLRSVDQVLVNGLFSDQAPIDSELTNAIHFTIQSEHWRRVDNDEVVEAPNMPVVAICGIGNPQRFWDTLSDNDIQVKHTQSFPDHHEFSHVDFSELPAGIVVMTHKDAVKCRDIAPINAVYLKVAVKQTVALTELFDTAKNPV